MPFSQSCHFPIRAPARLVHSWRVVWLMSCACQHVWFLVSEFSSSCQSRGSVLGSFHMSFLVEPARLAHSVRFLGPATCRRLCIIPDDEFYFSLRRRSCATSMFAQLGSFPWCWYVCRVAVIACGLCISSLCGCFISISHSLSHCSMCVGFSYHLL